MKYFKQFTSACLLSAALLLVFQNSCLLKVNAQGLGSLVIGVTNSSIKIRDDLMLSLEKTVSNKFADELDSKDFLIGSLRSYKNEWHLVTMITTLKKKENVFKADSDVVDTYLFLIHHVDGEWKTTSNDDLIAFSKAIVDTPTEFISDASKNFLSTIGESLRTVIDYKFPWPSGISYYYAQSWHSISGNTGYLDLGTTGADRRVLAAGDGVIQTVTTCPLC